jgi:hypothetical protein
MFSVRTVGALLFVLCTMPHIALAADPATPTPPASPSTDRTWGVYARLVGAHVTGRQRLDYSWHRGEGNTIVQTSEWKDDAIIRPSGPGRLTWEQKDTKPLEGVIEADGSVYWTRPGQRSAWRMQLVDGVVFMKEFRVNKDGSTELLETYELRGQIPAERIASTGGQPTEAAAPATAVSGSAVSSYLGFRGLEPFVGKRMFSPENRMYIELQHGSDGTLLISRYDQDGKPFGRYVLAESREQPGTLTMLSSMVDMDRLAMKAEWKSDSVLSLSSKSDRQGNWVNNLELSADGEGLAYRGYAYREGPIAGESRTAGRYVTPTSDLLNAAAREAERVKAHEAAVVAAAMASVVCTGSGAIGVDENGEECATDGEWDANEDSASVQALRGDSGQSADLPTKALYDSLVQANADADAQLARTQASSEATMAQARQPAAAERAQAAQQPATRSTASSSSGEAVMGFNGRTCAEGRAAAQDWVGTGGTFQVKSEVVQPDGRCVVQIHNWNSTGSASRQ